MKIIYKAGKWYQKTYPADHDWHGITVYFTPLSYGNDVIFHAVYDEAIPNEFYDELPRYDWYSIYDRDVKPLEKTNFRNVIKSIFK